MTHILIPREPSTALLRPFIDCNTQELHEAWAAMVRIAEVQHARAGSQCLQQIEEPATLAGTTIEQYARMFGAACDALGEISDCLGINSDINPGAEPIIAAIEQLRAGAAPAPVAEPAGSEIDWDVLPENPGERARFDRQLSQLYGGDPRVFIATSLRLWAETRGSGFFGAQCAVFANEVAKMHIAAPTLEAPAAPESAPWCPDVCPITGRTFFMWIDHWETGKPVPTYGGPYDSYTIPVKDSDGYFECERYDHDEGGWLTEGAGWHCLGVKLVNDQSFVVDPSNPRYNEIEAFAAAAPQASAAPADPLCWVFEDELPDSMTTGAYNALYPHSRVDMVRMFPIFGPAAPVAPAAHALSQAAQDVLAERRRQVEAEGYDTEHDDTHVMGEIGALAALYLMPDGARDWDATSTTYGATLGQALLPEDWTMPKMGENRRRDVVKGIACGLAELERLDRAAAAHKEST